RSTVSTPDITLPVAIISESPTQTPAPVVEATTAPTPEPPTPTADPPTPAPIATSVLPSRVRATPALQPAATSTPAPSPSSSTGEAAPVTVNLRAWDGAFNRDSIAVTAGARVTLVLQNDDAGVYHNVGVTMAGIDL